MGSAMCGATSRTWCEEAQREAGVHAPILRGGGLGRRVVSLAAPGLATIHAPGGALQQVRDPSAAPPRASPTRPADPPDPHRRATSLARPTPRNARGRRARAWCGESNDMAARDRCARRCARYGGIGGRTSIENSCGESGAYFPDRHCWDALRTPRQRAKPGGNQGLHDVEDITVNVREVPHSGHSDTLHPHGWPSSTDAELLSNLAIWRVVPIKPTHFATQSFHTTVTHHDSSPASAAHRENNVKLSAPAKAQGRLGLQDAR